MLSKFLRNTCKYNVHLLLVRRVSPSLANIRHMELLPRSQYDTPYPKKFKPGYALKTYWEIIPLVFVTCFAFSLMFCAVLWACENKVDVEMPHSGRSISRTMDLRNPKCHKIITINQRYEPWPEMQDVLDKMIVAEKRALVRAKACSNP